MRIEQQFTVEAPPERVWDFLLDVPAMASCVPGLSDVQQVGDTAFNATLKARIGPIAASFHSEISIVSLDRETWTGAVEVSGRDGKLGSSANAKMTMLLTPDGTGTTVRVVSDVEVLGKLGQYGHGMIAKRAQDMLDELASCVQARLR